MTKWAKRARELDELILTIHQETDWYHKRVTPKILVISARCHEWQGSLDIEGYGRIWLPLSYVDGAKVTVKAHRVVYVIKNKAPIPYGYVIDHLCRNHSCVKVRHLEAVTSGENTNRSSITVMKSNAAKTSCSRGHLYDEENTYIYKGSRYCRKCHRDWMRLYGNS